MNRLTHPLCNQSGLVGILGIILYAAIVLTVGVTMTTGAVVNLRVSSNRIASTQSLYNAESGAEDALLQMRRDPNFGLATTTISTTLGNNTSVDTIIEPNSSDPNCNNNRQVTSSGHQGSLVRRIRLTNCIKSSEVNAQFAYAVQVDRGGVNMTNNSRINGSLYSNGTVQGANGATVTSDVTVAGGAVVDPDPSFDPETVADYSFNTSTKVDGAQSFTATDSNNLIKVSLKIKKVNTPSNATIRVVADNGGKPSTTTLASGVLQTTSVGSNYGFVDISMTSNPALTAGNKYWIVLDGASSTSNYFVWASNNGYANQAAKYSSNFSGGNWTDTNTDLAFKVWTGGVATSLNAVSVNGNARANTITGSTIGKNAYYQTISGSSVQGASFPGSPDPPGKDMPISDGNITDFRQQCDSGGIWNGDYTLSNGATGTIGPLHITGNLNMSNNTTLYLNGPLCVDGSVNFSNNASIRMTTAYGPNDSTFIMSNVQITLSNNTNVITNGSNSFLMLLSEGTGGINLANNATSVILVTRRGSINVSNNGGANALVAYGLNLANNATITYRDGLADVNFSGGPGARWTPQGWQEVVLDQ